MAKKAISVISVPINNHFSDAGPYDNEIALGNKLKKIYNKQPQMVINDSALLNVKHINVLSFRKSISKEDKLVYDVRKTGEHYYIKTGLYVGYLFVNGIKLEINTGYEEGFLKRMLNVANNIYFNDSITKSGEEENGNSFFSLILEYLFLTTFKNAVALGLPTINKRKEETGLNARGKINFQKYITKDIYSVGKITYAFNTKEFDQDIIDVLFLAFNSIGKDKVNKIIPNSERYHKELKTMYSGRLMLRSQLRNMHNRNSLSNPMFSRYKKALKYAVYILMHKNIFLD